MPRSNGAKVRFGTFFEGGRFRETSEISKLTAFDQVLEQASIVIKSDHSHRTLEILPLIIGLKTLMIRRS